MRGMCPKTARRIGQTANAALRQKAPSPGPEHGRQEGSGLEHDHPERGGLTSVAWTMPGGQDSRGGDCQPP